MILSLCETTGNMVRPWAATGHECMCVDAKNADGRREPNIDYVQADIMSWLPPARSHFEMAFAFPPCTHLANSGNRWKAEKGLPALIEALSLVNRCREILEWCGCPWMLENPIGSLSTYWRKPDYIFQPWNYGDMESKATCLWTGGGFVMPEFQYVTKPEGVRESVWKKAAVRRPRI